MSNTKRTFPKRFKSLREAIGISQEEFAKALGVSRPTVSYYEKGDRIPDIEMLARIYETTGCSIDFLLGYAENMKPENNAIGSVTELSDAAIEVLEMDMMHSSEINFIITHPMYRQLMNAIYLYPRTRMGSSKYFLQGLDDRQYMRFVIMETMGQIADDYEKANRKSVDSSDSLFDTYHMDDLQSSNDFMREALMRFEKAVEQAEKDNASEDEAFEREHKEKMETDPVYRFRVRMAGHSS